MRAEVTDQIVAGLKQAGIDFISYLPESWLHDVYDAVLADDDFEVVLGTNEGECVAICAGAWLGGRRAAVIMENSGLRVAAEPLARLGMGHGIPVLMIMPFRGDFGDKDWWAQAHGVTLRPTLEALNIPYRIVERAEDLAPMIARARETLHSSKYHVAVIIGGGLCQ
jgi:sulfopyruvate decarboxylase subunit alpha